MSLLFKLCRIHIPEFYKRRVVDNLIEITAESFDKSPPSTSGLSYEEILELFAEFSSSVANESLKTGTDIARIQTSLYKKAREWGTNVKNFFRIETVDDVMVAEKLLYQIIGIGFTGTKTGEFRIDRCYFSNRYSPAVCIIFSQLDKGIAAGLSGGRLVFESRITEGDQCCRGRFYFNES